ncbi:ferritin-like domain-containing protein [Massilia sp. LXY-6]|uniref:ferritin-like domain-containing protein n=1 Tax=Massilia sp. LXY-6 TaxID=3379823 RepID=UPI003EE24F4D
MSAPPELRAGALISLLETDPRRKCEGVAALARAHAAGTLPVDPAAVLEPGGTIPGRPDKPELVPPRLVGRRSMATPEGRAMLVHALAHIEFNAINLALDAVWRFPGMPPAYYADWLRVAKEEAYHFSLLDAHLGTLGHAYGDFPGHDSLWEMVEKTRADILARMALVPRTLEARGLDAIPPLRAKLAQAGDPAAAAILDIILRDEVGHVEIGNRWYLGLCQERGLEPVVTYEALALHHKAPVLKGPFNLEARRRAGFTEAELARYRGDSVSFDA